MFRRFMIVCCVLFCFAMGTGIAGWAGRSAENSEIAELKSELESLGYAVDRGEITTDERRRRLSGLYIEIAAHQKPAATYWTMQTAGFFYAGLILLWNSIWHVGHWIWSGRGPA